MTTDELRAKFEMWYPNVIDDVQPFGCYMEGYASRDAEVEALRKDAERYRWLRNSDRIPDGDYLDTHLVVTDASGEDVLWNNSLDVTIDAAMRDNN